MNSIAIPNDLQSISDVFESEFKSLFGDENIINIRKNAFDKFLKLGFPNKFNEEYKYSSTEKLFKEELNWRNYSNINKPIDFSDFRNRNTNANHIFLVNGVLNTEASDLNFFNEELIVCDIFTASQKYPQLLKKYFAKNTIEFNDAFAQLNLAMANHGLFIYAPAKAKIEKAIQINNICNSNQNSIFQTHHIIVAENFAELNIIETFNSIHDSNVYVLNTLAEVFVGQNAFINYYQLQTENDAAIQINATQVNQQKDSHFDTNTVTLGGKWLRNNLNIVLNGTNSVSHLNGLQILSKHQHVDNHTLVDHQVPQCESNQLYKGILNDKSTGVFNGKIFVRKDAQKTNAYQSSKNMLLSDDATMNTKPQLEIYANDVKCSHGSSTGQIDDNALFYLRARGLSPDSAKSLLMYAFAVDVVNTVKIESYRNYLDGLIETCFE